MATRGVADVIPPIIGRAASESAATMTARAQPGPLSTCIAWGGALVFTASLAYFLYTYVVRDAVPAGPGPVTVPIVVDVLLFSVFALHHSVLARPAMKDRVRRVVPPWLERSLYTWTASVLFLGVCWWWRPVPGEIYRLQSPAREIAMAVQLAGIVVTMRASRAIDVLDLAGIRPLQRARSGSTPAHVPLETSGVYGLVRHPIYFGWALLVLAAPAMTATRAVFAIVSCLYLAIAIPWEERGLVETFGTEYEAYRQRVRWRMIPGVY
jgi:protein-S-isoprenylcysteine O-methyltransferase Ste14